MTLVVHIHELLSTSTAGHPLGIMHEFVFEVAQEERFTWWPLKYIFELLVLKLRNHSDLLHVFFVTYREKRHTVTQLESTFGFFVSSGDEDRKLLSLLSLFQ